jgi:hypothetical protein
VSKELEGAALDAAVAQIEGVTGLVEKDGRMCHEIVWDPEARYWREDMKAFKMWVDYAPSASWDAGGPIIERERIAISCHAFGGGAYLPEGPELWNARTLGALPQCGPTPLIAAMRCYVASSADKRASRSERANEKES